MIIYDSMIILPTSSTMHKGIAQPFLRKNKRSLCFWFLSFTKKLWSSIYIYICIYIYVRQTDRQTDRQAGRQAGRQTDRHTTHTTHNTHNTHNTQNTDNTHKHIFIYLHIQAFGTSFSFCHTVSNAVMPIGTACPKFHALFCFPPLQCLLSWTTC